MACASPPPGLGELEERPQIRVIEHIEDVEEEEDDDEDDDEDDESDESESETSDSDSDSPSTSTPLDSPNHEPAWVYSPWRRSPLSLCEDGVHEHAVYTGYHCAIPGCGFTASSPQHVRHHMATVSHWWSDEVCALKD